MYFDRKKFFDGFKAQFDHALDQSQVNGIEFLLSQFESDILWTSDLRNIAYALATIYHETAGSMQPVEEGYYLGKKAKAFQKTLRYYPYYGRGYVQLTWKGNYQKAGQAIGIDLVNHPELALLKENAFQILTLGMFRGWFSKGNTLGKYIHGRVADYRGARRIINGTDKAALIAGYAQKFENILNSAATASTAQTPTSETRDNTNSPPLTSDNTNSVVAAEPVIKQEAENIINTGDQSNTPPPEDKTLTAPAKDGATATSTKMVIAGVTIPPIIAGILKAISDAVSQGYVQASDIGTFLLGFLRDNVKWVLLLLALMMILLIVKKIIKTVTFWIEMLTHAIPGWNNIIVEPAPPVEKKGWLKRVVEWVW